MYKEDGSRVWKSYEDYLVEQNQKLALKARYEVMLFLQGMPSDFLEKTPEVLAMKEVEEHLLEKATQQENDVLIEDTSKSLKKNKKKDEIE